MNDEEWGRLKRAALEYSAYRPRLDGATLVPVANQREQPAPAGAIGVEDITYGERLTLYEVLNAPEGAQGWCFHQGSLYLTPAPTTADPIGLVWQRVHPADELTRSFPTIPATDMRYVEWLAEAEALDQATDATAGLSSYTIGSTKVEWSQPGGGAPSGASRAYRLRQQAILALSEPLTSWG